MDVLRIAVHRIVSQHGFHAALMDIDSVVSVIDTSVSLNLALRTAEKRNPAALVPLTSVVAGDKAGLLLRSNPVIAVVATGIAFHLPLRTAEKSNSNSLIPLTSVVAGNKARLLFGSNPVIAVVATGVATYFPPAHCRKAQSHSTGSPHKCCCGR